MKCPFVDVSLKNVWSKIFVKWAFTLLLFFFFFFFWGGGGSSLPPPLEASNPNMCTSTATLTHPVFIFCQHYEVLVLQGQATKPVHKHHHQHIHFLFLPAQRSSPPPRPEASDLNLCTSTATNCLAASTAKFSYSSPWGKRSKPVHQHRH